MERRSRIQPDFKNSKLTRRQLFWLTGLGLAAASGGCLFRTPEQAVRRDKGVWSKDEVIRLANEMGQDLDLNDMAYAGNVLLRNQNNEPSLSETSLLFEDGPIVFETLPSVPTSGFITKNSIMRARFRPSKERMEVKVNSPGTGQKMVIDGPLKVKFEEIAIGVDKARDFSDFAMKFFVAKEIFNVKAHEDLTSILAEDIFAAFGKPSDPRIKNVIKLSSLRGLVDDVPAMFIVDIWAHYYLIPDFNTAKDKGLFTSKELDSDALRLFHLASEQFTQEGLLKGKDERYGWNQEAKNFWDVWFGFSSTLYRVLSQVGAS